LKKYINNLLVPCMPLILIKVHHTLCDFQMNIFLGALNKGVSLFIFFKGVFTHGYSSSICCHEVSPKSLLTLFFKYSLSIFCTPWPFGGSYLLPRCKPTSIGSIVPPMLQSSLLVSNSIPTTDQLH
jgi:hypothetical protein